MTSSDTWKLSRILGTGGFGTVELWIHVQSGKKIGNIYFIIIINICKKNTFFILKNSLRGIIYTNL